MNQELEHVRLLSNLRHYIRRAVATRVHHSGIPISLEMLEVLYTLGHNPGGLSQQDLVQGILKDKASISRLTDKLEQLKMVSFTALAADQRINLVKLTPYGEQVLKKLYPNLEEICDSAERNLSDGEKAILTEILTKMLLNFKQ
jgi:MarR family 2-MHQ and catechol resistance regulon transcriptional repressor